MRDRGQLSGPRLASLIGAVAGALFIVINAGHTGAAAGPIRVVGVVLFVMALTWGVVRAPVSATTEPSPQAWRIYRTSVVAEIAAIPLGAIILTQVFDRPDLTPLWVVAVVGVHFLPFSRAFETPIYTWLGATMILLAVGGTIVTVASGSDSAPAWIAVGAGVALLCYSVAGPHVGARRVTSAHP